MQSKITRQDLYRLVTARDVFTKGYNLYTKNAVTELNSVYDGEVETLDASVADDAKVYRVKVFLKPPNNIQGHMCKCSHHTIWRGACSHVVAALFRATDGAPQSVPMLGEKLVCAFESLYLDTPESRYGTFNAGAITLYPRINIGRITKPYLSFEIGSKKRYVLQDIERLIENIKNSNIARYGNSLEFRHTKQSFDDRSRALIELFFRAEGNFSDAAAHGISRGFKFGRQFPLTRDIADGFFEIYNGASIEVCLDDDVYEFSVTDDPPDAVIAVDYENNAPVLRAEGIAFYTISGHRHGYFIHNDRIHIVDNDFIRAAVPLIKAISESYTSTLGVRPEDALSFHTAILPALQSFGAIKYAEPPPGGLTPPKAAIHLDCVDRTVICTLSFRYGDAEINSLSQQQPSLPRDYIFEARLTRLLANMGFVPGTSAYMLGGDDEVYNFYTEGLAHLREFAEVFATDEFLRKSYIPATKAKVGIRIAGNLIEVDMSELGYSSDELLSALESWRVKKKYHRLTDGRFVEISAVSDTAEILDAFDVEKSELHSGVLKLPMYRGLYLKGILERLNEENAELDAMAEDFNNTTKSNYVVPAELDDVLRPYQKIGYEWLRTLADYKFGGILADEMGLGKTIQVIALIQAALEPEKPSVVISPTSLVYNWEREFKRFAPTIKTAVVVGVPELRKEILREDADVFITTYDTLKRDIDAYAGMKFKYAIADEAQYMKNPATQNASAVKELQAEARFALTGTPIENSLTELWSVFDFVMPGYLYSLGKFSRVFESPIIKRGDEVQSQKLRRQIQPFILRRLKKDVLTELPDKAETVLYAGMEDEQRFMYAAHLLKARDEIDSADQMRILAMLTRLRQICCHPALFVENYRGGSGKLELAMDTIVSAVESGHRVLLFSQFTTMLRILTDRLTEVGLEFFYLDGITPAKERLRMTERFNSGERDVFAISLKAGGTGLNLTGADVVVHYDPWWNPAVMDQATDRAHRFGQDKLVQVINLVAKDSIEERILELQAKKKGLVDSVISEGGTFLNRMTSDEIKELFAE